MSEKIRASYTLEFKRAAVRWFQGEPSLPAAARKLGVVEQTLHNCTMTSAERSSVCGVTQPERVHSLFRDAGYVGQPFAHGDRRYWQNS